MFLRILVIALVTAIIAALLTGALITFLRQRALDVPNERSSHDVPKPRGGGLAIFGTFILVNLLLIPSLAVVQPFLPLIAGATLLIVISVLDDFYGLGPLPRFATQILAVVLGVTALNGTVFQGLLPPLIDKVLAGLIWLWFINLFNFMDGIDGLAAAETIFLGIGIFFFTSWPQPAILAAATLGFLIWNWAPAKIFLGDVGSIPLGYLFGGFLLSLAETRLTPSEPRLWAAALILPAYFLADATVTLVWRLYRGELIWQAHRQHFYQLAVQNGRSHRLVAGVVIGANVLLLGAAILSFRAPLYGVLCAILIVGVLMWWMVQKPGSIIRTKRPA
jgi:UDP-N-acetylmuramyl pentapeptide phosphotransferase/UDP-N-acetylglucosamine-1-phosphate transferase